MFRPRNKRITRNYASFITLCVIICFIKIWNVSYRDYRKKRVSTELLMPLHHFTHKNDSSPTFNIKETTIANTINKKDTNLYGRIIDKLVIQSKNVVVFQVVRESFTLSANQMTRTAFEHGTAYFILTFENSTHIGRDLASICIQNLIKHTAKNIGVVFVVDNKNIEDYCIVVHRSHIDMFNNLFPKNLNYYDAIQWLKDIYKPYHITTLNIRPSNMPHYGNVAWEYMKNEGTDLESARNTIKNYILSKMNVLVVSYSLYGSDYRYVGGALANAELIKTIYKGWIMWIYHDNTVPLHVLSKVCEMDHIICLNMTGTKFIHKMCWRFLVASVDFIGRFVVRDIDSRLSVREKAAVNEWIESGKTFHVMRDHPAHSRNPINGGLWGGTREAVPYIEELLQNEIGKKDDKLDMTFLTAIVWPIAKHSVYQHDSFSCEKYGGGHPFPTIRIGLEHVGSVYINGEMKRKSMDTLKKTKPPDRCVRHF